MEAILKFELPEEDPEFKLALMGSEYYSVLWDLDQHLRSDLKHNDSLTDEEYNKVKQLREKLHNLMSEHGVSFD
jgi:hypothetical protein